MPLPEGWTMAQGAAYPVQALTAYHGLVYLSVLARGHVALVHSAAGRVGLHAMAMAPMIGATVIGTVGHADKVALLEARGLVRTQVVVRNRSLSGAKLGNFD
jgi:alcohol dehydrogenase